VTLSVVSALGFALAIAACKKPGADSGTPSAEAVATESAAPPTVISAEATASDAPPADSAAVPTQADYEQRATQTAAKQSLDTQVNALEKQINSQ
jgi:hypothetical protein